VNKDGFFYKLKSKAKHDPLVPVGMILTSGVLFGGLYSMVAGNSAQLSQKFMRARVVAQAATVVVMCTGGIMLGNQSLGEQPNKSDAYEEMLLAQIEERRQEDKARAARVAALTEKPKA